MPVILRHCFPCAATPLETLGARRRREDDGVTSRAHPSNDRLARRGALTATGVTALLALLALLTPAEAAASEPGGRGPVLAATSDGASHWSVVPADTDGPDGRVSLRHVLDPGDQASDQIAVTNHADSPAEFTVTAGDGIVGANGAFDVSTDDAAGAGTWIDIDGLDDGRLTLDGGQTQVLPVTVTVPSDTTPGDHPAGIVVGMSGTDDGLTITHRIGVRLHLQVSGDLNPTLQIRDVETTFTPSWIPFAPGTLRVDYQVANTGNVRLGAATRVDTAAPFGLLPTRGGDDIGELLPGETLTRSIETSAWPLLRLSGAATLTPIVVGEDQVALPEATERPFTVTAVPWTGLVLVLVAVGAGLLLRRRRKAKTGAG